MQNAQDETGTDQDILMELETHPQNLLTENINPNQLDESKESADETQDQ